MGGSPAHLAQHATDLMKKSKEEEDEEEEECKGTGAKAKLEGMVPYSITTKASLDTAVESSIMGGSVRAGEGNGRMLGMF